jgi:hypothetical protein
MKVINFIGGALFAFGLLTFVDSRIQQSAEYTVSQFGQIQRGGSDPANLAVQQLYQANAEGESRKE